MPAPLLIGAAALVTAAYGAKKGYDGYQKHSEADEKLDTLKDIYENAQHSLDQEENNTTLVLSQLGKKQIKIGRKIHKFKNLADDILHKLNNEKTQKFEIKIPPHELQKIEEYGFMATEVWKTAVGAGTTGVAVGFATYGSIMALGTASTGTAISTLSGAAATNATLATLGGGSLATGGLGVAGGTAVLGAAVAAPIVAIAGWAYDKYGEKALENAKNSEEEVDKIITKIEKIKFNLIEIKNYIKKIKRQLKKIFGYFRQYLHSLIEVSKKLKEIENETEENIATELKKISEETVTNIQNGLALAAIMVDIITTPIFKVKTKNGEPSYNKQGVPKIKRDSNHSMILNKKAIKTSLRKTEEIDADLIPTIKTESGICV